MRPAIQSQAQSDIAAARGLRGTCSMLDNHAIDVQSGSAK